MGTRYRVLAATLAAMLTACGATTTMSGGGIAYPVGPSLAELGLAERCGGPDLSCGERAQAMLDGILGDLGASVADPAVSGPQAAPPEGRLTITVDRDPPFEWSAEGGASGTAARVVLDLTGVVDGSDSYVVVGTGQALTIDPEQAAALVEALFVQRD